MRESLPGPALDSPGCMGGGGGVAQGSYSIRNQGKILGLGYALQGLGVVDQGGYCRGSGRVLPLESNEHFLLGIL